MKEYDIEFKEIPKGWVLPNIGELFEISYGLSESLSKTVPDNELDVPVIRIPNVTESGYLDLSELKYFPLEVEKRESLRVKRGDVLFNWRNAPKWIGKSAVFDREGEYVNASFLLKLRPFAYGYSQFVALCLNHLRRSGYFLTRVANAVNQANFNASMTRQVSIPIPPLDEQRRIIAKIEELFTKLDAGVASLKAAKKQLKRYRQSVLNAAVEGELTREWREQHKDELEPASVLLERILRERREKWESDQLARMQAQGKTPKDDQWKERYQEPASPDTAELLHLTYGWVWTTLPQIGELSRGKSKHRPRNDPKLYGGEYPFVQTGDIRHANGVLRTFTQTYSEEGLRQSRLWKTGTLCITVAANIAETAILGFDACFPDSVVGFVVEPEHCDVRFVEAFFRTAKDDIERYAPATAQKNINLEILSDLAVPLPPLAEQGQIVAEVERRFSIADEIETTLDAELKRAERLRRSILKRAFEGKLVPQDPNDEPASALLERIKAERAIKDSQPSNGKRTARGKKLPPSTDEPMLPLEGD